MRRLVAVLGCLLCACAERALDLPSSPTKSDLALADLAGHDASFDLSSPIDLSSPVDLSSPIPAPRPIAPMSTSTVTSQTPLLRWELAPGTNGAEVTICKDRACTNVVRQFTASGTSVSPSMPLSRGLYYWRLRGMVGSDVGTLSSPVWEMVVGARSAPVATAYGTFPDVNGDGYADVLVGAHQFSSMSSGAWLYLGSASGLSSTAITLALPGPGFGTSVASAGDVNGDGYGDVAIGGYPNSTWLGTLCVFLGGPAGLAPAPSCFMATQTAQATGGTVAGVGDVDGDGYGDIVIGGSRDALGGGGAYLYRGSAAGVDPMPIMLSPKGNSVTGAGDLNADGYADVAVATFDDQGLGHVLVFLGSADGPVMPPIDLPQQPPTNRMTQFGRGVAGVGDIDGDGYCDLAIGAAGQLFVYRGGPMGPEATPTLFAPPGVDGYYGTELAAAGDIDGDGYSDVVTSSLPHLYRGGPSGLTGPSFLTTPPGYWWGTALAGAGDIDGDGIGDLVIGASSITAGAIAIYPGASSGFGTSFVEIMGPGPIFFGYSVARLDRATTTTRQGRKPQPHRRNLQAIPLRDFFCNPEKVGFEPEDR